MCTLHLSRLQIAFVSLTLAHNVVKEEVHLIGNEGIGDTRVINSYPSKIGI